MESITREAYQYAGNDPVNRTDPTGLFWGEGVLGGIGDFFTGSGCGDGGLFGDITDAVGDIDLQGLSHALATGLSYASFIPGPVGLWAAGGSAAFYALSGDMSNASVMLVVLATAGTGTVLINGVKGAKLGSVPGVVERPFQFGSGAVIATKVHVYGARYAVGIAATDWSWLTGDGRG